MTNRGTAKKTRQLLKVRKTIGEGYNAKKIWVDPAEEKKENAVPHAERHPNDITRGINLIKRMERDDDWYPNSRETEEMERAMERGFTTGVPGSVHYNGKDRVVRFTKEEEE